MGMVNPCKSHKITIFPRFSDHVCWNVGTTLSGSLSVHPQQRRTEICPGSTTSEERKSSLGRKTVRLSNIYIYEYQRNYFYYGYYRCNGMIGTILESMECLYMKTNGFNFEINDAHTCFWTKTGERTKCQIHIFVPFIKPVNVVDFAVVSSDVSDVSWC